MNHVYVSDMPAKQQEVFLAAKKLADRGETVTPSNIAHEIEGELTEKGRARISSSIKILRIKGCWPYVDGVLDEQDHKRFYYPVVSATVSSPSPVKPKTWSVTMEPDDVKSSNGDTSAVQDFALSAMEQFANLPREDQRGVWPIVRSLVDHAFPE